VERPSSEPLPAPVPPGAWLPFWAKLLLFAAAYAASAELGHRLTLQPRPFAAFWPPSGIFVAALLLSPGRRWPWIALAAGAASLASNLVRGTSPGLAAVFLAANLLEALAGAALVRRFAGGRPVLSSLRGVLALVGFCAGAGSALSAAIGAAAIAARGGPFWATFAVWWPANAVGVLVVAPLLLAWLVPAEEPRLTPRRIAEVLLVVAVLAGAAALVFGSEEEAVFARDFALLPPLLWATLRFGARGAATGDLLVALAAVWSTAAGLGELAELPDRDSQAMAVQFLIGVISATQLVLAAVGSEQRRAEAGRRLAQFAMDHGTDPMVLLDPSGRVLYANEATARLLGLSRAETEGRPIWQLAGGAITEAFWRDHWEELARVGSRLVEVAIAPGGKAIPLELSAYHLSFDGREYGVHSGRDLSERRQAEASLRMAGVGTMAAGMAHEINNPLAFIVSNLGFVGEELARLRLALPEDVLRREELRVDETLRAVAEAREGAERVRNLVRDLKVFSRPEDEGVGRLDVRRPLDSALAMARNEIRHRARLEVRAEPVPPVQANENRLAQVFLNLLMNAAQAIPDGHAGSNAIRVAVREDAGEVVVEIADTGCGMAPEVRERVFEPFFTTKAVGTGMGLGLSISHGIVKGLGGRIVVESEPGKGSVFRVVLPASPGDAAPAPEPRARPVPAPVRGGRILVVDDDAMVAGAVARILSPPHQVQTESSPRAALGRVGNGERFDLVLCDLMMPEMSGMDFLAALEREEPGLARRLIFITGGAFTAQAREFLERSPNLTLEKPFSPTDLRDVVAKALATARG
jgi:PAS domain S-box-containing protein